MAFGLIIVGDEILSGKRQDKHLPKVIELLGARGLALSWARYIGDDPARLEAALREAFAGGTVNGEFACGLQINPGQIGDCVCVLGIVESA